MRLLDRLTKLLGLDLRFDLSDAAFDRVADRLFLGRRPTPEEVPEVQAAGITQVVSCLPDSERRSMAFLDASFETVFVAARDDMGQDLSEVLPLFTEWVRSASGATLVHCEVGVSRSATLATAHLMDQYGCGFAEAYRRVRARRPQALPNVGFATQLQRYEQSRVGWAPSEPSSLAWYLTTVCRVPAPIDDVQAALSAHDHDAVAALRGMFGGAIPRVVQGARLR